MKQQTRRVQQILYINRQMSYNKMANNNQKSISGKLQGLPPKIHTFSIYLRNQEVATVALPASDSVADLMQATRDKLESSNLLSVSVLCLESTNNQEVLDYALLVDSCKIGHLPQAARLRIVVGSEVSDPKWVSLNDFQFKKCLGQGASASVFLVRHLGTGKLFALKQIDKNYFVEFKRMQQILREKKIMTEVLEDFPFTVKLYASFESFQHLNFLLEFYPGGEMFFHLQKRRFSQAEARIYFSEMVLTFQFLHSHQIIYRDLKPENIMIDFDGHARLTDFGLCKINLAKEDLTTSYCGSIEYMAPEVKESEGYNYSVDFYTLGAFLYEMVNGVPPYYNDQPLQFQENSAQSYQDLVRGLIEEDVLNRITSFKTIRQHKWMNEIDWGKIKNRDYPMPLQVSPFDSYIHEEFRSVQAPREAHSDKFDRLFQFFNFIKTDQTNISFLRMYQNIRPSKNSVMQFSGVNMRKKQKKNKSFGSGAGSSRSSSQKKKLSSQKSGSEGKAKPGDRNIYLKKTREDTRATTPGKTAGIVFQKLKVSKSGVLNGMKMTKQ